jgi:predicted transcriptional regulator
MENQRATAPSITHILKKIADDKALILFNSIAVSSSNEDRYVPLKEMNLSTKQYYSRIAGLTDAGLIKRHKGRYSLTMVGKVVYQSQMIIGKALFYYWKLKALESIEIASDDTLPEGELPQLINALIDNHQIKDILMKSISNPSGSNSKIQAPTAVVEQIRSI